MVESLQQGRGREKKRKRKKNRSRGGRRGEGGAGEGKREAARTHHHLHRCQPNFFPPPFFFFFARKLFPSFPPTSVSLFSPLSRPTDNTPRPPHPPHPKAPGKFVFFFYFHPPVWKEPSRGVPLLPFVRGTYAGLCWGWAACGATCREEPGGGHHHGGGTEGRGRAPRPRSGRGKKKKKKSAQNGVWVAVQSSSSRR